MDAIEPRFSRKNTYKEVDLRYNSIGSFRDVNPFTLAFCRTRDNGNVLIKGGLKKVEVHIKKNLGPCLVAYRFYYKGASRGYVRLENCPEFYMSTGKQSGRERLYLYSKDWTEIASWRRCPSTFPNVLREHYAS